MATTAHNWKTPDATVSGRHTVLACMTKKPDRALRAVKASLEGGSLVMYEMMICF